MKYVKDDKREQQRLAKLLMKMANAPHVAVGILQDEKRDDGFSMVDLAVVHEYGSKDGRIPQRSFIRSTCDEKRHDHAKVMAQLQQKCIAGKLTMAQALTTIGEVVSKDMVQTINNGIEPGLAESTEKAKLRSLKKQNRKASGVGFRPLIESGKLKGSITHEVRGSS